MILNIAVRSPLHRCFDYLPPESYPIELLKPGIRILIPFGKRECVGILMGVTEHAAVSTHKLKRVHCILDEEPLIPIHLLGWLEWASSYYHHPIGDVLFTAIPVGLKEHTGKEACIENISTHVLNPPLLLNESQKKAFDEITRKPGFEAFLLYGVTGSGKTEVYLQCVEKILSQKKQALVLVPEISLIPQTVARFQERFATHLSLIHSGLSQKQREKAWWEARTGQSGIVIGTRSAVFTPLARPGMIILDEEHDLSYKQQSGFRYSARDCAVMRAQRENIPIILASATPSLESLYNVKSGRYHVLTLSERAIKNKTSKIEILDIRGKSLLAGMSKYLIEAIQKHTQRGNQVLLFLNRRGFATTVICHGCGWVMECRHCDARLTLHQNPIRLYCHHCGGRKKIQKICPNCHRCELIYKGLGTEQLEAELQRLFKDIPVVRIDRDSTRLKNSLQNKLEWLHHQQAAILVGTQMVTKGHHFPRLTLVGVIDADYGLFGADFRAMERMGQLLIQVSGRAGRVEDEGEVIIQTRHPHHPLLKILLNDDYQSFADILLNERKNMHLPPYHYCALIRAESTDVERAQNFLTEAKRFLGKNHTSEIIGPLPSTLERKGGWYRYQLLVQSRHRQGLHQTLDRWNDYFSKIKKPARLRIHVDVDPQEVL